MATKAKITCQNCNNSFDVFWANWSESPIRCPYCLKGMDSHMQGEIKAALATVADLNQHFLKYHLEHQEPLFVVSVEHTHVPLDKFD